MSTGLIHLVVHLPTLILNLLACKLFSGVIGPGEDVQCN